MVVSSTSLLRIQAVAAWRNWRTRYVADTF
jgi:hypothetical protein